MKISHFKFYLVLTLALTITASLQGQNNPLPRPSLESLIQYALEHNFAIEQAQERIIEQEGLIVEVKADFLPNATLDSFYSEMSDELVQGPVDIDSQNWNVAINVRQVIYSGGSIRSSLRAQNFVREAVVYELQSVIDEVVRQTRIAYYDVLLARDRIVVQEQNVELLEEQLEDVQNRFEAETISQFDLLRAEVELANAQPALIRANNAFRNAIDNLYLIIGYESDGNVNYYDQSFLGELSFRPYAYNLNSLIIQAKESRPEVVALRNIADARKEGISVAKAGYLPEIFLTTGYELAKYQESLRLTESTTGWSIGLQSSWALFDGRRTRGRVMQARSQQRQAEIDVEEQKLTVDVEVRRAVSSLTEAEELAEAAQKVVEQAEESLRLAQARFDAGAATQLDVLQAQVALTDARTNELESNYSYLVAVANLRRAAGDTEYTVNN